MACWLRREFAITPEGDHLLDAIAAVDGEHRQDAEIENQNRPVKAIEAIGSADV